MNTKRWLKWLKNCANFVLISLFTEWDVVYCSVPTSPGGGYRSALGRLIFKTNEMIQVVQAPDTRSYSLVLVNIPGNAGKLKALDDKWIQVIFEPPVLTLEPSITSTVVRVRLNWKLHTLMRRLDWGRVQEVPCLFSKDADRQ
ncbi:hypothetical protein C3L33_07809, partial [Rhododendron williamsianum]